MSSVNKVVLAYSGGLDTSVIVRWLQDTYDCEVVTFTADIGQGEEVEPARAKAEALGVKEIYIDDLREEFVRDFVFPMENTPLQGIANERFRNRKCCGITVDGHSRSTLLLQGLGAIWANPATTCMFYSHV